MKRRGVLSSMAALLTGSLMWCGSAEGQALSYPNQPITIFVGFAPGGPADTLSRAVGDQIAALTAQPVVVENRPGANGKLAIHALLRAPKDGHALAYISPSLMTISPLVDPNLGFNPSRDLLPLTTALRGSVAVVVHPSLKVRNLRELLAWSSAHPGKLNYGSAGIGSTYHFATERLLGGMGIHATHIPYKGEAPALADLLAGHIQLLMVTASAKAYIDDGRLVAIASTGTRRATHAPDAVPAFESGIPGLADYDETPWSGFAMPAGAAPELVQQVHDLLVRALQSGEVRSRMVAYGEIQACTPIELQQTISREIETNRMLLQSGRVQLK